MKKYTAPCYYVIQCVPAPLMSVSVDAHDNAVTVTYDENTSAIEALTHERTPFDDADVW